MILPLNFFWVFSVLVLLSMWPNTWQKQVKGGEICVGSRFQRDFSQLGKEGMGEGTWGSGCSCKRSRGCGEELGVAIILKGLPHCLLWYQSPSYSFHTFKILPHAGEQAFKQGPIWTFQIMKTVCDCRVIWILKLELDNWYSDPALTMWNTLIVI